MIEMQARANGLHKGLTAAEETDRKTIERWGYEIVVYGSAIETADIADREFWFLRVTLELNERASARCGELVERFGSGIRLLQLGSDIGDAGRRCITLLVKDDVMLEVVDRLSEMMVRRILHIPVARAKSKAFGASTCPTTTPATGTATRLAGVIENTSTKLRRLHRPSRMRVAV